MWPYQNVTRRQLEEKKDAVEAMLRDLGAVPTWRPGIAETALSARTVYQYRDSLYRVDEVLFPRKPFLVIECADREEYARNNTMEDAEPFPWDLGEEELLAELQALLEGKP